MNERLRMGFLLLAIVASGGCSTAASGHGAGGPIDVAGVRAEVAQYVKWHVVAQQQAVATNLAKLEKFGGAHPQAHLSLRFVNGRRVLIDVRVEAGYLRQTRQLLASMPTPSSASARASITVSSYRVGVRHARAVTAAVRRVIDQAEPNRHPRDFVAPDEVSHRTVVYLTPGEQAFARRLYQRFGDDLEIRLGQKTYPLARAAFVVTRLGEQAPATLTGGCAVAPPATQPDKLQLSFSTVPSPSTSNYPTRAVIVHVRNRSSNAFQPSPGEGYLIDPRTKEVVTKSGFGFDARMFNPAPAGGSVTVPFALPLDSCTYDAGYTVAPGRYQFRAAIAFTPEMIHALATHPNGVTNNDRNYIWVGGTVNFD